MGVTSYKILVAFSSGMRKMADRARNLLSSSTTLPKSTIFKMDETKAEVVLLVENGANVEEADPFALDDEFEPSGKTWSEMSASEKSRQILINVVKVIVLFGLLYLFICSLSFLSSAFRLLGGKVAGGAFSSNAIIRNPVAGLMIGILATVLVQSSSTSTSIVVAMVASKIIDVRPAIPIVMGANIGTSVTNTLVSLTQASDRSQFRRAFAGAVVHDMFNLLSVVVFLPLEVVSGYLYRLTDFIVREMNLKGGDKAAQKDMLKKITKPFTNFFIQLDKQVIEDIAMGKDSAKSQSLIKYWCDKGKKVTVSTPRVALVNQTVTDNSTSLNVTTLVNHTSFENSTKRVYSQPCSFLLHDTGLSDNVVGAILLVISLIILCCCLVAIVKLLHSMLRGKIAGGIKRTLNSQFPKPFGFLTGYFAIGIGAGMTFLVQSSSIFTSTLTPLVGLGLVSLDSIYPLTLGANIGTTATGILAALASSSDKIGFALQIALCHLFFNVSGILLWYPVPAMRRVPLKLAKALGNTTAKYRWFAPLYILFTFFLIPGGIFALSLAGWYYLAAIGALITSVTLFVLTVNLLQRKAPVLLPVILRTWEWAPQWTRSLEPHDRVITKVCECTRRMRMAKCAEGSKPSGVYVLHAGDNPTKELQTLV